MTAEPDYEAIGRRLIATESDVALAIRHGTPALALEAWRAVEQLNAREARSVHRSLKGRLDPRGKSSSLFTLWLSGEPSPCEHANVAAFLLCALVCVQSELINEAYFRHRVPPRQWYGIE